MPKKDVYIDFHCHPEIKTFLSSDHEKYRDDCWKDVDVTGILEIVDTALGKILDSQCSLTQIKDGNISIVIVGLYSCEKAMITGKIIELFNSEINLLKISRMIKEIDHNLLKRISSPNSSYYDILQEVREHLLKASKIKPGFKLLNKISEYNPKKLNVILTIEGGHALYDNVGKDEDVEAAVLNNLDEIKKSRTRYFFLTMAHLTRIPMCSHAYGIKIIDDDRFKPIGKGISSLGEKVIHKALKLENGRRLLIDIKHMSLKARLSYYKMLESDKYKNIPIIISHAGITGVSKDEMPVYEYKTEDDCVEVLYNEPAGLMGSKFNPSSINLYDEEIKIIIDSGGIIGINLDERILGTKHQKPKQTAEYFSREEFEDYKQRIDENLGKYKKLQDKTDEEVRVLLKPHNDLKHICNNILHIVKIKGAEAWKHICIGSDFDGMINAVECCKNSGKFKKLHRNLVVWLPKMARRDKNTDYSINNIEERVKDIMFGNAYRFLQDNFK